MQNEIPYVLTGPDGTRAVFNDPTDLDYIGRLDAEDGVSGLDSPEVRESADVLVEADGGVHGSFYYGRRPIILKGWIDPDPTVETANRRMNRIKRAANAMRADAELRWTEDGQVEQRLLLRRQQPVRITDRRPKTFLIPLVSARSAIESAAEQQAIVETGATGYLGFSSPLASPLQSVIASGGQQFVINAGDESAYPVLTIKGPISNPRVLNNTTGEELRLLYELGADETLTIDARRRTVILNGNPDASRYAAVEFPASTWWALRPGNNDIRLNALAASAGAQCTVAWRHAWT